MDAIPRAALPAPVPARQVSRVGTRHRKRRHMVYLEITLKVRAERSPAAVDVYNRYRTPFLQTVTGAKSKQLLVRDDDVQVLHGFDTEANAQAYLKTSLFERDIVSALGPLLDAAPDLRVYVVA